MLANAVSEMADAQTALNDAAVPLAQREKRVSNATANHAWTSKMLLDHLDTCVACRARESAMRPAFKGPIEVKDASSLKDSQA